MNDCYSVVTIHSSPWSIKRLKGKFSKLLRNSNRLVNLLRYIGYSMDDIKRGDVRAQGNVESWCVTDVDEITLNIESPYVPNVKCIKEFVDYYVDDADIKYYAEEPSVELFWSNDPCVIGTVYIDRWFDYEKFDKETLKELDEFVSVYFDWPEDIVKNGMEDFLGHDGTYEELAEEMDAFVKENGGKDSYIYFYTYQEMSLDNVT